MNYILAFFIPPLALILTGRIGHAILSAILCVVAVLAFFFTLGFGAPVSMGLWAIAVIHAWFVIHGARVDRRVDKKLESISE